MVPKEKEKKSTWEIPFFQYTLCKYTFTFRTTKPKQRIASILRECVLAVCVHSQYVAQVRDQWVTTLVATSPRKPQASPGNPLQYLFCCFSFHGPDRTGSDRIGSDEECWRFYAWFGEGSWRCVLEYHFDFFNYYRFVSTYSPMNLIEWAEPTYHTMWQQYQGILLLNSMKCWQSFCSLFRK